MNRIINHFSRKTQSAYAELISYAAVLTADPAYISLYSAFASNPAAASSVIAFRASYEQALGAGSTISPDFLQGLPTEAQGVIGSAYMAEASIIRKHGLDLKVPKKSGGGRALREGTLVGMAAGLAGFLGIVLAL